MHRKKGAFDLMALSGPAESPKFEVLKVMIT
jgi:hypothetical protein